MSQAILATATALRAFHKNAFQPVPPPQQAAPPPGQDPNAQAQAGQPAPQQAAPPPQPDPNAQAAQQPVAPPPAAPAQPGVNPEVMVMIDKLSDGLKSLADQVQRGQSENSELKAGHQKMTEEFARKEGEMNALIKSLRALASYEPPQPVSPEAAAVAGSVPDPAAMAGAMPAGAPAM